MLFTHRLFISFLERGASCVSRFFTRFLSSSNSSVFFASSKRQSLKQYYLHHHYCFRRPIVVHDFRRFYFAVFCLNDRRAFVLTDKFAAINSVIFLFRSFIFCFVFVEYYIFFSNVCENICGADRILSGFFYFQCHAYRRASADDGPFAIVSFLSQLYWIFIPFLRHWQQYTVRLRFYYCIIRVLFILRNVLSKNRVEI